MFLPAIISSSTDDAPQGKWRPDIFALGVLGVLTAILMWHRWVFDDWLSRHDILAFFLPWYGYLGDRLAAGDIPGWLPSTFGGVPFAADPESGWMYLPAMLLFPFFEVVVAYKLMILVQLVIAGTSTYTFSRMMGLGAAGALVAAMVYELGPLLYMQTDCCTVSGQLSPWIPVALLGVELSLRARQPRHQLASLFLAGLAISQMMAAWVGQGAVYGVMIAGAWVGYRTLIDGPGLRRGIVDRVILAVLTGGPLLLIGLMISAAGLLPRLAYNAESNNPGGSYEGVPGATTESPYLAWWLLKNLLSSVHTNRAVSVGGVVFVLAIAALLVTRRKYAVPFWIGLFAMMAILAMHTTLLHRILYFIPEFEALHVHSPRRIMWIAPIGVAMLAGIGLHTIPSLRASLKRPVLVFLPGVLLLAADLYIGANAPDWIGWPTYLSATLATLLLAWIVYRPQPSGRPVRWIRMDQFQAVVVGIVVTMIVIPHAMDLGRSFNDPDGLTQPNNLWQQRVGVQQGIAANISRTDRGGAGEFLQRQQSVLQPFRYVGYSGRGYEPAPVGTNQDRRIVPNVMAILTNGRPTRLGLQEIQGYNPVMLQVWADWMGLLNGRVQNYHYTDLLPGGLQSPLLDMLNVRYILLDATLPPDRPDVVLLTQGRTEVSRNGLVVVYENPRALPRAWIVHQVQSENDGGGLSLLAGGLVNGRQVAFVDGPVPQVQIPGGAAGVSGTTGEGVTITRYSGDEIRFQSSARATGLMVVSEIYAKGWTAYLDGERVDILKTNHSLRGVVVPGGVHEIVMKYEPEELRTGLWLSGFGLLTMMAAFVWSGVGWAVDRRGPRGTAAGTSPAATERAALADAPAASKKRWRWPGSPRNRGDS